MPIVKTTKGNLITMFKQGQFHGIAHGCNCFHTMGAGVAASIAQEFPEALREDEKSPYGEAGKLGEFSVCETDFGWIYNAYTQFRPGREDRKRLYDSIKSAFVKINEDVRTFSPEPFILGIPKIGAGLARGDWATIAGIINSASPSIQITLVEYE